MCQHACNATDTQENGVIQNKNMQDFCCQNNADKIRVFVAVCWKMGGRKGHSFTEDLITLSCTIFAFSLSEYMPTLQVSGQHKKSLLVVPCRAHGSTMPLLVKASKNGNILHVQTNYCISFNVSPMQGEPQKKSPVMTKICSWENFRVLLLFITSLP